MKDVWNELLEGLDDKILYISFLIFLSISLAIGGLVYVYA